MEEEEDYGHEKLRSRVIWKKGYKEMTVRGYSPALLDIFKLASEKEFIFDCKTEKKALALRARLHYLRREMRKEKHWLTPVADSVIISVNGSNLIAHPPDNDLTTELETALKEQGLKT